MHFKAADGKKYRRVDTPYLNSKIKAILNSAFYLL